LSEAAPNKAMAALGDALAARIVAIAATKPAKWKIRMEHLFAWPQASNKKSDSQ
jgi:hypothetical protein